MARTDKDAPAWVRECQAAPGVQSGWRRWAPSRRDRHHDWFGPERASTRDQLRAAARDFNTYGDTDLEPSPRQHRHAVRGGGWWD